MARLVAVLVVLIAAAISMAASPAGSPSAAAGAAPQRSARSITSGAVALSGNDVATAGSPTVNQAAVPASDVRRGRITVRTMSMDAPIQGGLTAHQEQALSARLVRRHQTPTAALQSQYWTPAEGRSAVARAESWIGLPYSWAGGSASGPTLGRCDPGDGGDLDCHVVGFDCSGLTMYAWGSYEVLPHLAQAQLNAGGFHPTLAQLRPGDLVFFAGYLPAGTGHVAIYAGHGMVIEAPQSGAVIREAPLAEVMAGSGAYRGAVRPMTGATPTLTAPSTAVPATGGTVTLHGANLAAVTAVHIGGVTVQQFAQHSDSVIAFRSPAHLHGTVTVTVSTSWRAQSLPVNLTYSRPVPKAPVTPTAPGSTAPTPPPSSSSPTAPPSSSPVTPTPTPTPPPTSSSSTPTASSTPSVSAAPSAATTGGSSGP